ncbi:hypothetical protein QZH41_006987 [Actinostola sp. cb2023]|nr:hypothetical protein QZH41_006987 [Actinostola sp. cb2023]
MASYNGISQVHVGFGAHQVGSRNKIVRKWSEEQTDLFAAVLSFKRFRDGDEVCWSEELETLAVKKSSNEKLFKEIQASLEVELVKVDQSIRDPGDEATFTIPQLRAKYKWLKREWKIIQYKIKCGLLKEDIKSPSWYNRLHPIFSVYLDSDREERDSSRPSMVGDNNAGSMHIKNGRSNVDELSDGCVDTPERSWVVNIDTRPTRVTTDTVKTKNGEDELELESNEVQINIEPNAIQEIHPSKRTYTAMADDISTTPAGKIRRTDAHESTVNSRSGYSREYYSPNYPCTCSPDREKYVEIIKYLLDAEERRERMFVDFQRDQAEANRQHQLKMAQVFVDMSSQQKTLTSEISYIKQLLCATKTTNDD